MGLTISEIRDTPRQYNATIEQMMPGTPFKVYVKYDSDWAELGKLWMKLGKYPGANTKYFDALYSHAVDLSSGEVRDFSLGGPYRLAIVYDELVVYVGDNLLKRQNDRCAACIKSEQKMRDTFGG